MILVDHKVIEHSRYEATLEMKRLVSVLFLV